MLVVDLRKLENHEYADLFPMLEKAEQLDGATAPGPLTNLAADLRANGCHTPVVLHEGRILDGRNRIAAAVLAGLTELPTVEYGGDDPLKYVLSLNLHRRQLNRAQLAELGFKLEGMFAGRHGNTEVRASFEAVNGGGKTADLVIEHLGGTLSGATFERAKAVATKAPDLWRDVQRGARSISGAYRDMTGPPPTVSKTDAERFEKLFDTAVSRISELIADYTDGGADDIRYVTQNLSNLIGQAERTWA